MDYLKRDGSKKPDTRATQRFEAITYGVTTEEMFKKNVIKNREKEKDDSNILGGRYDPEKTSVVPPHFGFFIKKTNKGKNPIPGIWNLKGTLKSEPMFGQPLSFHTNYTYYGTTQSAILTNSKSTWELAMHGNKNFYIMDDINVGENVSCIARPIYTNADEKKWSNEDVSRWKQAYAFNSWEIPSDASVMDRDDKKYDDTKLLKPIGDIFFGYVSEKNLRKILSENFEVTGNTLDEKWTNHVATIDAKIATWEEAQCFVHVYEQYRSTYIDAIKFRPSKLTHDLELAGLDEKDLVVVYRRYVSDTGAAKKLGDAYSSYVACKAKFEGFFTRVFAGIMQDGPSPRATGYGYK